MIIDVQVLALHSAIWGDPEVTAEAIETGAFRAELFTSWRTSATATALIHQHRTGEPLSPVALADQLEQDGLSRVDARESVVLPGAFVAAGCRRDGLGHYLHRLAEAAARRSIEAELMTLANALHFPGGPARVAAKLGVTV